MKNIKRILAVALLCVCVFSMTAYAGSFDEAMAQSVEQYAESFFTGIVQSDDASIDEMIDYYEYSQDTVMANGLNSWKSSKKELGEFITVLGMDTEYSKGTYTTTINAKFVNRDCEFVFSIDEDDLKYMSYSSEGLKLAELTFNPVYTLGEKMSQAGVNLAVGMGTVFAVLIFLTLIISLFKYVNIAEEKLQQKKSKAVVTETAAKAPAAAPAPAPAPVATPAVDGNEIQAVIAAAIMAYESECGGFEKQPALNNGLVIRSYKRS